MLSQLMRAIFGSGSASVADEWGPVVAIATEKAVDGTDSRLRAIPRYKDKLREPVLRAAQFSHELGEAFAAPLALSRDAFAADVRARAFFSSAARMQEVVSTSQEVRRFLDEPGNRARERFHAALAMRLSEREVLGPVLSGDRIRRDEKRTLASFDEHRVILPAVDEASLRKQLKERAFTTLVECALERLAESDERKKELEKHRALLRAKLRALRSARCGLDSMSQADGEAPDTASIERALEETDRSLRQVTASGGVLERNLEHLRDTLTRPDEYLRLAHSSRLLTRMGYVAGESEDGDCDLVEFDELTIAGQPLVIGVLVSFPVAEIESIDVYASRARRALGSQRGPST